MKQVKHASNGKRDIHGLEAEYDASVKKLEASERWKHDTNRKTVIAYLKDCKKGLAKSGGRNKRVGKSSLYRILGILRMLSEDWVKKDFDKTSQKDWDAFYDNMEEDKLKNAYGKKFKPSSKAKNYKTIRKFLKWKFGNNKTYPEFCEGWVTTEEKPSKYALTRPEVERMVTGASTLKMKFRIMVLFDGGFRVEEYGNLRWMDLQKPEGKDCYRAKVRSETSKTGNERLVSLWLATDLIESYRKSLKNPKPTDYVDDVSYDKIYKSIRRIGERVLGMNVTPHVLRHSSATYYASVIKTYQQFCSRYGWALRSEAPQRYFHAVADEEIANQTKDHEIARFRTEFERTKVENKMLRARVEKQQGQIDDIMKKLAFLDTYEKYKQASRKRGRR